MADLAQAKRKNTSAAAARTLDGSVNVDAFRIFSYLLIAIRRRACCKEIIFCAGKKGADHGDLRFFQLDQSPGIPGRRRCVIGNCNEGPAHTQSSCPRADRIE